MFVPWQTYRTKARSRWLRQYRERNGEDARLKAILVESARVNGKPRQRHIAFLGSVSIGGRDLPRFRYEVTTRLDQLSNRVSPEDRQRIAAAIAEKVVGGQLMTPDEMAQFKRRREELWTQRGTPP
jgi:hypothetical protein